MWRYIYPTIKVGLALLVCDILGMYAAFNLTYMVHEQTVLGSNIPLLGVVIPVTITVLYLGDTYRVDIESWGLRLVVRTIVAVSLSAAVLAVVAYLTKAHEADPIFWRRNLITGFGSFAVMAAGARLLLSMWAQWRQKRLRWLVVGNGEKARFLQQDFESSGIRGGLDFLSVGRGADGGQDEGGVEGTIGELEDVDRLYSQYTGIIIASDGVLPDRTISQLMNIRLRGVKIYDLTEFYETFFYKVPVLHLQDGWFALSQGFYLLHKNIHLRIKRMIDILLATILGLIVIPVVPVVMALIWAERQGPIFYSQIRTGLNGVPFRLYKFRTMISDAEKQGPQWTKENDPRITPIGRLLRLFRIDEVPQLWNVLKGEMSFIGPRPERPEFNEKLKKEIPYYNLRYLVRPGITGWAQVMYPYAASIEDALVKLQYDLYYIKNYSLLLDFLIAAKTIRVVIFGRGR